jgi:signal transduction histidine kinase
MRLIFFFFILFNFHLQAQILPNEQVDSVRYYIELANYNTKINNYKNALIFAQKAIEFSENTKNENAKANALSTMGSLYFKLKKYSEAITTLNKSIILFQNQKPTSKLANIYYLLGLSYMEKGKPAIAEKYFDKAESIYNFMNIPEAKELLNLQKGIVYKSKGQNDMAMSFFEGIISKPDNEDIFLTKAEALFQIGTIEASKNRNNLALNYFKQALELNSKNNNVEQKSKILHDMSLVYDKMLDKSNAYILLKQHLNLNDSITNANNKKLGTEDYEKFKETERLKEIENIDKDRKEEQKSNKFSKLISILAIALISILSLLSLSLYKNNIIRNQSNLLLKEKNNELLIAKNNAEKASKARAEFLSTVSHELRTPLNAINGITHLLMEENPKESQLDYLTSLKFSGNYLLTFINEILETSRVESQTVEAENTNFNLKLLLENIQNSLKEIAANNNNDFKVNLDGKIPENLVGDPTKLSQIFINLINNALKFTKNGKVTIVAKLLSIDNDKSRIHFEIIDTGIGIPQDKLETVFESFSQGSIEINRTYGGTGLGLTIVKKLIEILGGKINLESKLGEGSTFSFDLNFKINQENIQEDIKHIYDQSLLVNKKILLVEDNKINQMITKKMLENKKMSCIIVDNGEDAIENVRNNDYDLVLMDVHLPGINGTIATQKIREFNSMTPIVALTAISLNENREMLISFGMNDVITKPFIPENFYDTISKYVE